MEHKKTVLANGLNIVTAHMHNLPAMSMHIVVKVGARYESQKENGIAHFLEHMAFKGTTNRKAKQISEEFDALGAHFNASTGYEHTYYSSKFLKEHFEKIVDLFSDILENSTYQDEEIEKELSVILQEIAQTNDSPDELVYDNLQKISYLNQSLGRSILGEEATISSIKSQDLKDFIKKYYIYSRMVISVAGSLEHEKVVDIISKKFTKFDSIRPLEIEKAEFIGGISNINKDLEQVHFMYGFEGTSYLDKRFYASQVLGNILGGGMSSKLFQEIRENRGLAYSVGTFAPSYYDTGLFVIYGSTTTECLDEMFEALSKEFKNFPNSLTSQEIERAKTQFKASSLMSLESSYYRAEELARNYLVFGRNMEIDEIVDKLSKISRDDLVELLEEIMLNKKSLSVIGKEIEVNKYMDIFND